MWKCGWMDKSGIQMPSTPNHAFSSVGAGKEPHRQVAALRPNRHCKVLGALAKSVLQSTAEPLEIADREESTLASLETDGD